MRRAREGDPGRLWVVSSEQTAAHGRRGRPWSTPRGNLAASLLLVLPRLAHAANLGFVAGLALHRALGAAAPGLDISVGLDAAGRGEGGERARLALKWPNDLLLDGGKLAGILLEAGDLDGGLSAVVIGIGVNVAHAPTGLPYAATSLAQEGAPASAETVFAALSDAWVEEEALWAGGRGFADIRRAWLERASGIGEAVAVQLGGEVIRGTFDTIDEDGRLLVRTSAGELRAIAAGEVHFSAAATMRT
ncbi:biotin--[acetyl-CoA-carboxylase] ligase [Afifella pfennigii]|uniref:biotin--[acetyl-CoA-carboxylase] ligase n=1 Tax=Afifella pfennigii TaxID=209897 RepID=UPI000A5EBD42|nr:biotin--[acetyl-CoA-carboxylase] ligase [Afifella pfennigii]